MTEFNKQRPYAAFYKDKRLEVFASSAYAAQLEATKQFKAKKSHDVTVMLLDVVHTPT
jgi:hypothetical protein